MTINISLYDNGLTTAIIVPLDHVPIVNKELADSEIEFWNPHFYDRNPDNAIIIAIKPIREVANALGILTLPIKTLNS